MMSFTMVWTAIVTNEKGEVYKEKLYSSIDASVAWKDACHKYGNGNRMAALGGVGVIALVKGNHPIYSGNILKD